jgi:hypothetical protein
MQQIPFKNLIPTQLVNKFPAFYGNRIFIALLIKSTTGLYPEAAESISNPETLLH